MGKNEVLLIFANILFLGLASMFGFLIFHHSTTSHDVYAPLSASFATTNTETNSQTGFYNAAIDPKYTGVTQTQSDTLTTKVSTSAPSKGGPDNPPATNQTETVIKKTSGASGVSPSPSKKTQGDPKTGSSVKKTSNVIRTAPSKTTKPGTTAQPQKTGPVAYFQEVYEVPKGYCALTFDDGPSAFTKKIAEILHKNQAPATFFFIGENVKRDPSAVTFASHLGFVIGDHSYTHPKFTNLSSVNQNQQMVQAKDAIQQLTHKPVTLFRPPYGAFNRTTEKLVVQNGMKMALWNDDPRDWADTATSQLIQTLSQSNLSGKVIDLHDKKVTYEALPEILKIVKQKGLKLTAI